MYMPVDMGCPDDTNITQFFLPCILKPVYSNTCMYMYSVTGMETLCMEQGPHVLLLPQQLLPGLLHLVQSPAEGVGGGRPLRLQVCGGLLDALIGGLPQAGGALHL